jgi:hypothetical protein
VENIVNMNANEVALRVLAGCLSVIMTFLMFLPMKAAFGNAAADLSGHYSGSMEITSEYGQTTSHPAVAVFRQSGHTLSGSIGFSAIRQTPLRRGRIHGETVSFSIMLDSGMPLEFQLTAKGGSLSGSARAKAKFGAIHAKVNLARDH